MILMVALGSAPVKRITGSFKALDKDAHLFSSKRMLMAAVCVCARVLMVAVYVCVRAH